jgi:hypothetical protein
MTLHHTATGNDDVDPAGTVRAIYAYHTVDNGWRDIGYHYLVGPDGTVFEGRWSGDLGSTWQDDTYSQACAAGGNGADFAHASTEADADLVVGAHAGGYNTGNVGVALLGSFAAGGRYDGEPTPAAVAAAEGVLAEFAGRHGIDPLGTVDYANAVNSAPGVNAISGHRDYSATECPGDNLYILLPQIRARVAALLDLTPPDDVPTLAHVADLDGTSARKGRSWTATVTVTVRDDRDATVAGATVSGHWAGDPATCTTGDVGTCTVRSAKLARDVVSVTFEVLDVSAEPLRYDQAANTDPDSDSDGTTIRVERP